MAEPVSTASLLAAFAKLVASQAGKQLTIAVAKEIVGVAFGHLATKDDLRKAVEELKRHIDQRWDDYYDKMLAVGVTGAKTHLEQFTATGDIQFAYQANEKIVGAKAWVAESLNNDPEFARTHFVIIVRMMSVDVAIWASLGSLEPRHEQEFKMLLQTYKTMLAKSISTIESWEHEILINERVDQIAVDDGNPKVRRLRWEGRGSYDLVSRKYPNGRRFVAGPDGPLSTAGKWLSDAVAAERKRIQEDADFRETQIYAPARAVISAVEQSTVQYLEASNFVLQFERRGL